MKRVRKNNINTVKYWDEVYKKESKKGRKRLYIKLWKDLIKFIPDDSMKIVDIGCGGGHLLNYIAKRRSDLKLFGTDFSGNSINYARKICPSAQFLICDSDEFPFDNKFNLAICSEVLEHIEDPFSFVKRICFIIKDGGYLITTTPWRWGSSDPEHIWDYEQPEDIINLGKGRLKLIDYMISNEGRTLLVKTKVCKTNI